MIHAYALEPALVATWAKRTEYRFVYDKFGLGTPRAMLALRSFTKFRRDVRAEARSLDLTEKDKTRLVEILRILEAHKCRRGGAVYDGLLSWLENAEVEYDRKPFAGIVASTNPRAHRGVLVGATLDDTDPRWACTTGLTVKRTAADIARALAPMLIHCRELHLIDPHFRPDQRRYSKVLAELMSLLADNEIVPDLIRVHCDDKYCGTYFEDGLKKMPEWLPMSIRVEFQRWTHGKDRLHNRYVLTDLGGISLGAGLDERSADETDDLLLLSRDQYVLRWKQYVENDGSFKAVDTPAAIQGTKPRRTPTKQRSKSRPRVKEPQ